MVMLGAEFPVAELLRALPSLQSELTSASLTVSTTLKRDHCRVRERRPSCTKAESPLVCTVEKPNLPLFLSAAYPVVLPMRKKVKKLLRKHGYPPDQRTKRDELNRAVVQ